MRFRLRPMQLLVLTGIGSSIALGQVNSPSRAPLQHGGDVSQSLNVVGQIIEGYQLILSTTNSNFAVGEPIVLTSYVKNVSTNSLPILTTSSWFNDFHLEVVGPDGKNPELTQVGTNFGVTP